MPHPAAFKELKPTPDESPSYESQASFLGRHGLFLPVGVGDYEGGLGSLRHNRVRGRTVALNGASVVSGGLHHDTR
jgi:hypothetical protein